MSHDVISVLLDILIVLVAAKVAAEIAERVGIPAVVGEIVAGIVVGPSVLGLVGNGDVLRTLGELGVVLLLLEVGMEMDLGELGKVGRVSLLVATVGVIAPLGLGLGAMLIIGDSFNASLFVAAALTATSVGITARVFGDLGALSTTEARVVLGAAVADDVIGLIVLTVVVRVVTQGSVSPLSVAGILAVAIAFLVVGGIAAIWVAPRVFAFVERRSRSAGTLVAAALVFTLAFAELADAASLAVVVGAFLAGLALGRTKQADRIRRELAPVGHLFIPVFFLAIGIDVDVTSFVQLGVLRDAGILLVVAVLGKLVSSIGTAGTASDKLLIGLGMLPRGEVGLIFATIGLANGVLNQDLYAALLLVVLVTTLVTPVLLRARYQSLGRRDSPRAGAGGASRKPPGGWFVVTDEVRLVERPSSHLVLEVAFAAAEAVAAARPSSELLDWFAENRTVALRWTPEATRAFAGLLEAGNTRSWRFLEVLDVLPRALPELRDALRDRQQNPLLLDTSWLHRWDTLERLTDLRGQIEGSEAYGHLEHPDRVLLAGFLLDVLPRREARIAATRRLVGRLDLGARAEREIALLVDDPEMMLDLSARPEERPVLELATHLGDAETVRAAYVLAAARADDGGLVPLRRLHDLVQSVIASPEFGADARELVNRRRADAVRLSSGSDDVVARIDDAPREYLLSEPADAIAAHAELLAGWRRRGPNRCRVGIRPTEFAGRWLIDVVADDRAGLLARVAHVLQEADCDVVQAVAAGWPDGAALESCLVEAPSAPDSEALLAAVTAVNDVPLHTEPLAGFDIGFDDGTSPWFTVCTVTAPDAPGLLSSISGSLAAAGVDVHRARISVAAGTATDRFTVSYAGGKLPAARREVISGHLARGVGLAQPPSRRALVWARVRSSFDADTGQKVDSSGKSS